MSTNRGMQQAAQKQTRKQTAATAGDLRQFTIDFFTFFGADVRPLNRRKQSPLAVDLPPELADYFGASSLQVAFHNVKPGDEQELVAHGSRLFDRMLGLLARRGAMTYQTLPNRYPSSDELMRALQPLNAGIANLKMQEETHALYVFNWRITYRADDKREELYSVVLDAEGQRVPLAGESGADPDHEDAGALDLGTLWADATPVLEELDENGQPLPPKLPPMAQLARLAETARKYAIYHADLRCVNHEADILPRLYQVLNRLTTYYGQQIEEVHSTHDPTGSKRRDLETDLERKIAEEVENHRLRVQVILYSYAILQTPVALAQMTLSDGKRTADVQLVRNRYTGALQRPPCHACGAETDKVALDRNGHLCCDACVQQCTNCREIVCAACGVEACPVCGQENCDACGEECWACGARACADHVQQCPVCGDGVCLACQVECAACHTRQCRSHLRADAVADAQGEPALICAECAVRCPGCNQYSAQLGICQASGQRFCAGCLVTCHDCGRRVGPGFYERDPSSRRTYCNNCLTTCERCGAWISGQQACSECGELGCAACMAQCELCHKRFCRKHLAQHIGCGHLLCPAHQPACHLCQETVCPVCLEECAICGQVHCHDHLRVCRRCEQVYCSACVHRSGLCTTCGSLEEDGVPVAIHQEPWAQDPAAAELIPHYRWRRVSNTRYIVFVGENSFLSRAVIVVARRKRGGQVVRVQRLGMNDRLREGFGH